MSRRLFFLAAAVLLLAGSLWAKNPPVKPRIDSMSALAFSPDGVLFVGDGKGGAVFALHLGEEKAERTEGVKIENVEAKIAARLGTRAADVMIHDLAVNPVSQNIYLSVSRGRGKWDSRWKLPNDVADAGVLMRVDGAGKVDEVALDGVRFERAVLPNPVAEDKVHTWKEGTKLRADTITDMAYQDGTLFVAGLSNEEFASTLWRLPVPFDGKASATTLEIFHGAHGEYETHAPIRTFVPYELGESSHLLAAYLCTPFVTFEMDDLKDGSHVKGRTVAEFGSGNYPLDMIVYSKNGEDRLLIANSNLPLMIVDPDDVAAFEGSIDTEVEGYVAGVSYEVRPGAGILQIDRLNDELIVALTRLPGGTLELVSLPVQRL